MRKSPAPPPQPLKPLVFQVLLALVDGERHGWSLVREVQQRGEFGQIMPGNFYRTLRAMLADGLIEEAAGRQDTGPDDERRRYYGLTDLGREVIQAESKRLELVLTTARRAKVLRRSR